MSKNHSGLPDLSSLQWQQLTINQQAVRQLAGLKYPLFALDNSPGGQWLAAALQTGNPTGKTEITSVSEAESDVVIIDTRSTEHWWSTGRAFVFSDYPPPRVNWLADGRLLWTDAETHQVFIGNEQDRQDLNAPVPISGLVLAAGQVAFAQAQDDSLWRVDLDSGKWEEVTTTRPPQEGKLGSAFFMAQDGTYALAITSSSPHALQLWRVPATMGESAAPLADVVVDIVGHGGPSGPFPVQLSDGNHWLIGLPVVVGEGIWSEGLLVDTATGEMIAAEDLGLPRSKYPRAYNASPDGRWLAITLWDSRNSREAGPYLVPSNRLTAGTVLTNVSVAAWHIDPPAVVLQDQSNSSLSVVKLPLANDAGGSELKNAVPPLVMLPDRIVAMDANSPGRVLVFDLDGRLLSTLDLSSEDVTVLRLWGDQQRVFLSVKQRGASACPFGLLEWNLSQP